MAINKAKAIEAAQKLVAQGKLKEAIAQWQASLKEWEGASPAEVDHSEVAKVQKKLESAKVRLAKESGSNKPIAPK